MDNNKLKNLIKLLEINSYSENKVQVNRKLDYILQQLEGLPMQWERHKSERFGDFTVGRSDETNKGKPLIGLILHVDTVHKPTTEYPVQLKGDKLYGPGAQDMQASIHAVIEVLWQLHFEDKLSNTVVVFNTCEEKGSPEFQQQFKGLAEEIDYAMVFETGDNGTFKARYGADKHPDFCLASSRKGIFQQIIETSGPGGHSGDLTEKNSRKNAISEAVMMVNDIEKLSDYNKETTINIAYINGGQENTTIAENCRFVFDARFRYEEERHRLKSAIAEILDREYLPGVKSIDKGYNYDLPSLQPNAGSEKFYEIAESAAKEVDFTVEFEPRGGWCDGCNIYYYNPDVKVLDGFGPRGGGEHTRNEFVYIESIEKSIRLTKLVLERLIS